METDFKFDVFLSHSSRDKDVVRNIANLLKSDKVRVWFDEWELKPGDSIPSKIEEGLEHSRVLVLCMSANAFGSDWAQLESGTFRFRDPLNKERRFIPLRLDNSTIKGTLAQFSYIDWQSRHRERSYLLLLASVRSSLESSSSFNGNGCSFVTSSSQVSQRMYASAKVLLVGRSGAGKTALAHRLALEWFEGQTDPTIGTWVTQWKIPFDSVDGVDRDVWLWDFGGHAQRLIQHLFMDTSDVVVLMFDGLYESQLDDLTLWDSGVTKTVRNDLAKFLVAGRSDLVETKVSHIFEQFASDRGYLKFLETSAKTGKGCLELKHAITDSINWAKKPVHSSAKLYYRLKEEILLLRESGKRLIQYSELCDQINICLSGHLEGDETTEPSISTGTPFTDEELEIAIELMVRPGIIWKLQFGNWILLEPNKVASYATAIACTVREQQDKLGYIDEGRVLNGDLTFDISSDRLPPEDEQFLLLDIHQRMLRGGDCVRETTDSGRMLVFPEYYQRPIENKPEFRKLLPDRRKPPKLLTDSSLKPTGHTRNGGMELIQLSRDNNTEPTVSRPPLLRLGFRIYGRIVDLIYQTLIVRLSNSNLIIRSEFWYDTAEFMTIDHRLFQLRLNRSSATEGELRLYFDTDTTVKSMIELSSQVCDHIAKKATDIVPVRYYVCPNCKGNNTFSNEATASGKVKNGVLCTQCGERFSLYDDFNGYLAGGCLEDQIRSGIRRSADTLDNECKERILVGEVMTMAVLAGQIFRELSTSNYGIDAELEFMNNDGTVSGKQVYLLLMSDDSKLTIRKRDKAEIFKIPKQLHVKYLMNHDSSLFLIHRSSKGIIRWMEIRDHLEKITSNGKKKVRQIEFDGKHFDVMSIRRWRTEALGLANKTL